MSGRARLTLEESVPLDPQDTLDLRCIAHRSVRLSLLNLWRIRPAVTGGDGVE